MTSVTSGLMIAAMMLMSCGGGNGGESAFQISAQSGSIADIDGNTYPTVKIGEQFWMAANLATTRYNDGKPITKVVDLPPYWDSSQPFRGAWCIYENDFRLDDTYGKLYNWYAASNQNICPLGWHVPTDSDWLELEIALGMPASELFTHNDRRGVAQNVGGKMKSTILWNTPNSAATNESGFSALPGGYGFYQEDVFRDIGESGRWWSSSEATERVAWYRWLNKATGGIVRSTSMKSMYYCIRCVRG